MTSTPRSPLGDEAFDQLLAHARLDLSTERRTAAARPGGPRSCMDRCDPAASRRSACCVRLEAQGSRQLLAQVLPLAAPQVDTGLTSSEREAHVAGEPTLSTLDLRTRP